MGGLGEGDAALHEPPVAEVRSLAELLAIPEGHQFLQGAGVFLGPDSFRERLRAPAHDGLRGLAGLHPDALIVYAAHQVKLDYEASVVAKIRTAAGLQRRDEDLSTVFLWLDTDRAGADKLTGGFQLHGRGGAVRPRFSSRRHDDKETRFVPVERSQLEDAVRQLGAWARQHGASAAERHRGLAEALLAEEMPTLADAGIAVTTFLLRDYLGIEDPSVRVSEAAARGLLTPVLNDAVSQIDDVVTVFNVAVDSLIEADIDPQVHHLPDDYLPLHYSCDRDDRRCRLRHERSGSDHFAVSSCVCGTRYRFHLGSGSLSIDELAATGRWSTDVMLPAWLNDLASGVVVGRSSALYGIVLNRVLEKVLGRDPIPMLVPGTLGETASDTASRDTLLHEYFFPA
jgi:hypothetical protein